MKLLKTTVLLMALANPALATYNEEPQPPMPETPSGGGHSGSDLGGAIAVIGAIVITCLIVKCGQRGGNNPEITDQTYDGGKLGMPTVAE